MDVTQIAVIFLAAMTPIGELRLSIPLAIYIYEIPWFWALVISVLGNLVPVVVLVIGLDRFSHFILGFDNPMRDLLNWQRHKIWTKQSSRFRKYGSFLLVILVAIPLPMTGAWTGALVSWVFRVPVTKSIIMLSVGVVLAGCLVSFAFVSGLGLLSFLTTEPR